MSVKTPTVAVHKRSLPFLAFGTIILILLLMHKTALRDRWRDIPQAVGLGEEFDSKGEQTATDVYTAESDDSSEASESYNWHAPTSSEPATYSNPKPDYRPGSNLGGDWNYTKTLVVPRTSEEDVYWMEEELASHGYAKAIYVADDPSAPLHPPKNKGHEVMIYLTYIIDNYDTLSDISVFMHAHRWSWHNNDILDNDAAEMLRRLNPARVWREGYMNMRCHWDPGCPAWMHPGTVEEDVNRQEEPLVAKAWGELFPLDPIPEVLAQPCCAQFAISRERIQTVPLSRYVWYRDWLLRTDLSDYISGRVWEYVWQFVFTGQNVVCPEMHKCYCDGFGVCFGNEDKFNKWFENRYNIRQSEEELKEWHEQWRRIEEANSNFDNKAAASLDVPEEGRDELLKRTIDELRTENDKMKAEALERGIDPKARAEEVGREWRDGDGY